LLGGPVLHREFAALPRDWRLYFLRAAYVSVLFGLAATAWLILFGSEPVRTVGDVARFGSAAFALISPVQLALAMAFSALLTAAAVAQEKDRRTLELLQMTRLTNAELVLGRLSASLLSVGVLIVAAAGLMALLALLGGVSYAQIARVCAVTAAAAIAAGSVGSTIALWREKTFQTLALTALALVLWLLAGEAVAGGAFGQQVAGLDCRELAAAISPLRAIQSALQPEAAPLGGTSALAAFDATTLFLCFAAALAGALNIVAIARFRVWNPTQELRSEAPEERPASTLEAASTRDVHAAPGKARRVWDNPILWREVCTWAFGRKVVFVRLVYVALFIVCATSILGKASATIAEGELPAGTAPFATLVVVGLVLVNSLAVTSITGERDARALDLLLVTDLTPKEIIFGKLGGALYNAKEMALLPILLGVVLWWKGQISGENLALLAACLVVANAFVAMLGLHSGMTYANSAAAVGVSVGTLLFLLLGIAVCMRMMVALQTSFNYQLQAFAAFMVGGGVGLYCALGIRNPSPAIGYAAFLSPWATFYVISTFLQYNYGAAALVTVAMYGFATAAMLVPAIAEFDVATGRTTARDD
jgi:ABC-type transport system involved in multi-copper enzyme maturation permease subunit